MKRINLESFDSAAIRDAALNWSPKASRYVKNILAALILVSLPGCASLPENIANNPAVTAAATEAKNADAGCTKITGPLGAWGFIATWMNVAKGVVVNGDVTVTDTCTLQFSNTKPLPKVTP